MKIHKRGFTLIELLLVIGIIAILASIVIVAINPTKQLADARNAQRRSDVNTIINAMYQYAIDNNGTIPGVLHGTTTPYVAGTTYNICQTGGNCTTSTNGLDLDGHLDGDYVVSIPIDPKHEDSVGTNQITDYTVLVDTAANGNRVTVTATEAEEGETITVTR